MPNKTHRTRLARVLSQRTGSTYTQALRRVDDAAQSGLLPRDLTDLERALGVLLVSPVPSLPESLAVPLLGDARGELLGMSQGESVLFEPGTKHNLPPGILILGQPGSGKSLLGFSLAEMSAGTSRSICLVDELSDVDPYGPGTDLRIPRVVGASLPSPVPRPQGTRGAPRQSPERAATRALLFVQNLTFPYLAPQEVASLQEDFLRAYSLEDPTWEELLTHVQDPRIREHLQVVTLAFSHPLRAVTHLFLSTDFPPMPDASLLRWTWAGLRRPHDIRQENWSLSQRIANAVIVLMVQTAWESLQESGGGMLVIESFYQLLYTPASTALLTHMLRESRAAGITLVLSDVTWHLTREQLELVMHGVSRVFLFRNSTEDQARLAVELCWSESTPELVGTVVGLKTGEALYRDLRNRSGALKVNPSRSSFLPRMRPLRQGDTLTP